MTSADLASYEAAREAAGKARATVNRELELLLCAAYRLGATSKPRRISPSKVPAIKIPKVHNTRRGFLAHDQVEAILAHVRNADLRDFLEWRYWTAMRPVETARLTWEDVDLGAGIVTLPAESDKIGKGRSLAIAGPLRAHPRATSGPPHSRGAARLPPAGLPEAGAADQELPEGVGERVRGCRLRQQG